ncbi:MAG: MOSC domain-containing protein, partial [Planctomycetota bacterium]
IEGDGHDHEKHRTPIQAISLIDLELVDAIAEETGMRLGPGDLGENLTVSGVGIQLLTVGDRLSFDGGVALEITRVRPPCYVLDSISPEFKRILWNRIGMYARVLEPGRLATGAKITVERSGDGPRPLVRAPGEGCVDGAAFAVRVLAERAVDPVVATSPETSA